MMANTTAINSEDYDPHCGMENHENCDTIRTLKKAVFSVTIVSDVVTLVVLVLYRKYKTFSQRIFLNILLCNLVEAFGHLLNDGVRSGSCITAAFILQTAGFALFMWVCALTLFLFLLLMKKVDTASYEKRYNLVCWGVPLVLGVVPFITHDYGPGGAYCWVIKSDSGHILRFVIWWGPVMLGILLIFAAFVTMHCKAARLTIVNASVSYKTVHRRLVRKYLRPLQGYAAVFVVIHIIMFVDRCYTHNHDPVFWLRILQMLSISPYGIILCTLFFVTNGRQNEFSRDNLCIALAEHRMTFCCLRYGRHNMVTVKATRTVIGTDTVVTPAQISIISEQAKHCSDAASSKGHGNQYPSKKSRHPALLKVYNSESYSLSISKELRRSFRVSEGRVDEGHNQKKDISLGRVAVMELDELAEESQVSSVKPVLILQPDSHLKYSLHRSLQMLKVYYKDVDQVRWESWKDGERVEEWRVKLQSNSTNDMTMTLIDREGGAYFGNQTWGEIKQACSDLRIVIGDGITDIDFIGSTECENPCRRCARREHPLISVSRQFRADSEFLSI